MNKKQRIVLWIGIVLIGLITLFPPVKYQGRPWKRGGEEAVEYRFLLDKFSIVLLGNLVAQWALVSIIAGGLIYALREKRGKNDKES